MSTEPLLLLIFTIRCKLPCRVEDIWLPATDDEHGQHCCHGPTASRLNAARCPPDSQASSAYYFLPSPQPTWHIQPPAILIQENTIWHLVYRYKSSMLQTCINHYAINMEIMCIFLLQQLPNVLPRGPRLTRGNSGKVKQHKTCDRTSK